MLTRSLSARAALFASASLLVVLPAPASACGGLFCNRPRATPDAFGNPPPTQSGEQIVYGMESDGSLVMTVRIFYQGAAPEFAWILPVPVLPTISLGTDTLFAALDAPTRPSFAITGRAVEGTCAPDPVCRPYRGGGADAGARFSDGAVRAFDAASDVGAAGVTVELMSTLGPYETVVLSGGTGAEIQAWLTMHSYLLPAEAIPLLDAYASTHHHFVALRLHGDASIDQIQPITLTMAATAPCLPIRLTALATQPDLPITAFFLADARAVSSNFSMIDPAWDDLGLYTGRSSYMSYVTRQVGAAGGHAFVTDFAGVTPFASLELPSVIDLATQTDPSAFLRALYARGYLSDSHVLAILSQHVVPPMGMTARAYYNCLVFGPPGSGPPRFLDAGVGCGTPTRYDAMAAATAIDQTITQPRHDARALMMRHRYTTRLYTTMSAPDMTLDPEFRLDRALGTVAAQRGATYITVCEPSHYVDEAAGFYRTGLGVRFGNTDALPHRSPDAWCRARGTTWSGAVRPSIDGGHYPDGAPAPPAIVLPGGGGGCSCAITGGAGGSSIGAWIALIALAWSRARRRSR